MENLERVKKVFEKVFEEKFELFEATMQKNEFDSWDSINHLHLIMELEDEFKISFDTEEIPQIKSVNDILNKINQNNHL